MNDLDQVWHFYKKYGNVKSCFHYEIQTCADNPIIKAHSIQKNGVLSQIESKVNGNNLLYALDEWILDESDKIIGLKPIGKSAASVFNGFCSSHDKIFSEIEDRPIVPTARQLFLFTYRAFAHSYHQVSELVKFYSFVRELNKTLPYDAKRVSDWNHMQEEIQMHEFQLLKYSKYKRVLNTMLSEEIFTDINYHIRELPYVPITSAQLLVPIFTYRNIPMKRHEEFSYLVLNIVPDTSKTWVLVSHFPDDYKGRLFFDELNTLNDDEFREAISSILVHSGLNTFMSPIIWESYTEEQKNQLYREIEFCTHHGHQITEYFISKVNLLKNYSNRLTEQGKTIQITYL